MTTKTKPLLPNLNIYIIYILHLLKSHDQKNTCMFFPIISNNYIFWYAFMKGIMCFVGSTTCHGDICGQNMPPCFSLLHSSHSSLTFGC